MNNSKLLITIHSGGLDVPANSRLYLERACEKRPDIIEIDVRQTSDGVAILSHDAVPQGGDTAISEMVFTDLKSTNPDILTLEEAIDLCAAYKICLNLDIKEFGAIHVAAEIVRQKHNAGPFIFSGCRKDEIRELHNILPDSKVLYNAKSWDPHEYPDYSHYALAMIRETEELGSFGLNISYMDLRPELMGYSRLFDVPVLVWTVDDRRIMRELIMMGVYSITTNNIDLLREVISSTTSEEKRRLNNTDWIKSL